MRTVVLFHKNRDSKGDSNRVYSRSLRKVSFIDSYHLGTQPAVGEYWLVDILRENRNNRSGGCFILKPVRKIAEADLFPLIHGMYELTVNDDAIILKPNDPTKFWVVSPATKEAIMEQTPGSKAVVIDHGGGMWTRRQPSENLVANEARKLLQDLEDED